MINNKKKKMKEKRKKRDQWVKHMFERWNQQEQSSGGVL